MWPEEMESARQADARSDIWSLGVILFELLTNKLPFPGETLPEVCLKVTNRPAPPVRDLRPDVPEGIEAAILKCLEKDRTRRHQSVDEFCAAIAGPDFAHLSARSRRSGDGVRHTLQAPERFETMMAPGPLVDSQRQSPSFESIRGVGHTAAGFPRARAGRGAGVAGPAAGPIVAAGRGVAVSSRS